MKRTLLVVGMVLMLAMSAMSLAAADSPGAEIISPTSGELVYENTLSLHASDPSLAESDNDLDWAVVTDDGEGLECTGEIHFNRNNSAYTFEGGVFQAELDISGLDAGEYCFVFNTINRNAPDGVRLVQDFYIVDQYAKIGGNVDNANYLLGDAFEDLDVKELRGRQLSHAFGGVVGNAGEAGTVGSITVNYRQLQQPMTFSAQSLSLSAAGGLEVTDPTARAAVMSVGGSQILLLDKDATPAFERGAVIVRYRGTATMSPYEVDATPDATGADSWVALVNGNVEVGER